MADRINVVHTSIASRITTANISVIRRTNITITRTRDVGATIKRTSRIRDTIKANKYQKHNPPKKHTFQAASAVKLITGASQCTKHRKNWFITYRHALRFDDDAPSQ